MTPSRKTKTTECIVHQFLENQRKNRDALASISDHDEDDGAERGPEGETDDFYHSHPKLNSTNSHVVAEDLSAEAGLKDKVEHKGVSHKKRCDILALGTDTPDGEHIGQADEESWKSQITKSESELDMSHMSRSPSEKDELHSRLLTKKQLSEMAWGVRELSRRLSSMRIRFRVKNIFILTKIHDADLIFSTRELVKWLLGPDHETRYNVYLEDRFEDNKRFNAGGLIEELRQEFVKTGELKEDDDGRAISSRLRYWNNQMCRTRPHTFDFVITLGGDGTVLYASWLFQRIVPPILSFALGSLGFLTKFDFEEHQSILKGAFDQGVTVSLRLRFEGTIMRSQKRVSSSDETSSSSSQEEEGKQRDLVEELIGEERDDEHTHKPDGTFEILNEIVVDRGPNPSKFKSIKPSKAVGGFLTPSCVHQLTRRSNVLHRDLRRRRALHLGPGRWRLCVHPYGQHRLQPRRRRLSLPPREPGNARHRHLRAHPVLPPHHPPGHHRSPCRCAIPGSQLFMGQLRRP